MIFFPLLNGHYLKGINAEERERERERERENKHILRDL